MRLHTTLALTCITVISLLGPLADSARAQPFRYGLEQAGRVVVDTSLLDKLPGGGSTPWWDLEVVGSDRYALNVNGKLYRNGEKLDTLATASTPWQDLEVVDNGDDPDRVYALRGDGILYVDGEYPVTLPLSSFLFNSPFHPTNPGLGFGFFQYLALTVEGNDTYSLRIDGNVYKNGNTVPIFDFGELGGGQNYTWFDVALDPDNGDVYVLRTDGALFVGPSAGAGDGDVTDPVDALPAPITDIFGNADPSTLYDELIFGADGNYLVLRRTGQVFRQGDSLTPLVDFDGNESPISDPNKWFFGFTEHDGEVWAIRFDGRVFAEGAPDEFVFDYPKKDYQVIRLSDDPPDISNVKNNKPAAASYNVTTYGGKEIVLPVVVTDVDKATEDLIVTVADEMELPDGVTWDGDARTLTFDAALIIGSYKVTVLVDDGVENKQRKFKYQVKVKAPDVDPEKNKKPVPGKVKKAEALVGFPYPLTIIACDADGDPLTITPILDKGPFAIEGSDAAWDDKTSTMTWTPTIEDIGKQTAEFDVSDGTATKRLKVKITIKNALIFDVDEE